MKIPGLIQIERWIKQTFRRGNKIILIKNNKQKKLKRWQWCFFKGLEINIKGVCNTIIIHEPYQMDSLKRKGRISIYGNNNKIVFDENAGGCPILQIASSNSTLSIGRNTVFNSTCIHMLSENRNIEIGENSMFSVCDIMFGDGHSVIDKNTLITINIPEKDLKIGNHCWVGYGAYLTKNAGLADNSIVAMGSVVTKEFSKENVIIAGNPAKIIKTDVSWNYAPPSQKLCEYKDNKMCEIEKHQGEINENTDNL